MALRLQELSGGQLQKQMQHRKGPSGLPQRWEQVRIAVMTDLGIIIVNWNTRDYLRRCLKTVFASEGPITMKVVVVDNGSADGSVEMVRDEFPDAVLISGHGNVGYPAGNNLGLCELGHEGSGPAPDAPRYSLLLNP